MATQVCMFEMHMGITPFHTRGGGFATYKKVTRGIVQGVKRAFVNPWVDCQPPCTPRSMKLCACFSSSMKLALRLFFADPRSIA